MPGPQSISGRVRNFANLSKPDIQIELQNDDQAGRHYIHSFSTGDKIQGTAFITPPCNTRFDDIDISLVGSTKCYVDKISPSAAISARSEAFQMFLKMDCPIDSSDVPADGILQTGQTYPIPFFFTVPASLPGSCKHKTINQRVKDMHLQLPPSLGDPEMAGHGSQLMDDCAPEMCRISYVLRARILKLRQGEDRKIIVSNRLKKIRIVPGYDEQPPIAIDQTDDDYCLRAEKSIRKSLLKAKCGRLAIEATQPKSLHLLKLGEDSSSSTTMASIQLRFDPVTESAEPPKLGQLVTKLRIGTFFASTPRLAIPTGKSQLSDTSQGLYVDVCNLSARCMSATEWLKHEPNTSRGTANVRRDSVVSMIGGSAECPAPTSTYRPELPFYTTQLLIPISPPKNKTLVPSFQSCLVSRVYILELALGLPQTSSVSLKVPIQVTSEGGAGFDTEFPDETQDELMELEEGESIEQYLTPRRMSSPTANTGAPRRASPPGPRRRSEQMAPPPKYSSFTPRTGGVLHAGNSSNLYSRLSMVR